VSVSDPTPTVRAFYSGRLGGTRTYAAGPEARFRISLLCPSNRRGQTDKRTANQHHRGFIPQPGSRPRNRGNRHRRSHRRTSDIGLTGPDCRRRRNQPEDRQSQKPPTHKVEPRSPLVDGTPRPATLDKLQSMCHGGPLSNFGQNTAFERRGSIQTSKLAVHYPNVPKRECQ
jgi:hypothetical protein